MNQDLKITNALIPRLSFIPARGFLVFHADGQPDKGADHLSFRLNSQGGAIGIFTADAHVIDAVMYGWQAPGVPQGRIPDGAPTVLPQPIPGTPGGSNWVDTDHDGLPDAWELANGFNPALDRDARMDPDGDGQENLPEYHSGTDPHDSRSKFNIDSRQAALDSGGGIRIAFTAHPGIIYSVQYRDSLADAPWLTLTNFPAEAFTRGVEVTDQLAAKDRGRFYRVVIPPR